MNKLDTLTVSITAQDIKTAIRKVRDGWTGSPLTLAIRRAFDCKYLDPFITVDGRNLWICGSLMYRAGSEAKFMKRWEAGDPVRPMSFRLQIDPDKWAWERERFCKYRERRCWSCSAYVPRESCPCGRGVSDRECHVCQAVFCKTCFPARRPFVSCHSNPDRHLSSLKAEPFAPTFAHYCHESRKAVTA